MPHTGAVCLGDLRQPSGKRVIVWALEADLDATHASSNTFEIEWPRGSGKMNQYPEMDRIEWVRVSVARTRLLKGQVPFLDMLMEAVSLRGDSVCEGPPV